MYVQHSCSKCRLTRPQIVVFRHIVAVTLSTRSELYRHPDLADWSLNRGDRINKKVQQLLKKFGTTIPNASDIVAEEVAKMSSGKKGTTTPKKMRKAVGQEVEVEGSSTSPPSTPSPSKRRRVSSGNVKAEIEDED